MLDITSAQKILHDAGIRLTPQRLMVVEALAGNRTHPTVENIYELVRRKYPTVSLATVYHTVTLLARYGLIRELHAGKDGLRCDPDTSQHAHAYCRQCGKIADVELSSKLCVKEETLDNFLIAGVEVSLFGLCNDCRAQQEPAS